MLTAILVAAVLGQPGGLGHADREALNSLAGIYEANRAKFEGGRVWFEYTDAYATSADEAAKGVVSDAHKAEGFYAFQGNDALYQCTFSNASLVTTSTKVSENSVSHRLFNHRLLTNGKVTLDEHFSIRLDGNVSRSPDIRSGTEEFYRAAHNVPLALGAPEIARDDIARTARLIRDGAAGFSLVELQDDATLDGVKVTRIKVKGPYGTREMWVDPERGAIPLQLHDEMPGGSTRDLRHGDIRLIAGRGWLPHEGTVVVVGGRVFRTVVTKVDFGQVPGDTFRLEFPEPVAMVNLDQGVSYPPRKVWDLARLPSANIRGVRPVMAAVDAPAMPGERESQSHAMVYVALGLWVVVGVVGFLWWRGTHSASR